MAYFMLSNGLVLEGTRFGAEGTACGELVFYTDVVGYASALTDPARKGQMLVATFPVIGNSGISDEVFEKACTPAGFIVRELCEEPSNFRADHTLDAFLKARGVVGLCGVDTRALTRLIRTEGPLTATICDELTQGGESDAP